MLKRSTLALSIFGAVCACASPPKEVTFSSVAGESTAIASGPGATAILPILDAEAGPDENVFFSPLSVDYAFSILALGARGETAEQLTSILPPPAPPEAYSHNANGVELRLASRLWVEQTFEPARSYIEQAEARYEAGLESIDKEQPAESAKTINNWADKETNGLIPSVIGPDEISAMQAMVITNAIYFDGDWATKFSGSMMEPFLFGDRTDKPFRLMGLRSNFATVDRKGMRAIRLPYRDRRYAMDVIIPAKREVMQTAPALELIEDLGDRLGEAKSKFVDLRLPQFEIDTNFSLLDPLMKIGLTLPFDSSKADLSGMVQGGGRGLYVGGAKQLAKLQVFDTGTRAAAVTVLSVVITSAAPRDPRRPIKFTVDRPFIVVLRDLENDAILFLGRIANPEEYEPKDAEQP